MNAYNIDDLLTLGHVPTRTVEVPVSVYVPVLPMWAKVLLFILAAAALFFFIKWLLNKGEAAEKMTAIRNLELANLQKSSRITELEKTNWNKTPNA